MKSVGTKLSHQAGSSKSKARTNSNLVKYEGSRIDYCKSNTPIQTKELQCQLYSPILSQATLEETENLEVIWDWHSPRSKGARKQNRVDTKNSPKLLIKKYPSNNVITEFDKLNEELKSLTDEIVETSDSQNILCDSNLDSVFNDSMEAELLVCSQKVEKQILEDKFESKVDDLIGMKTPTKRIINLEIAQTSSLAHSVNNLCSTESVSVNNNIPVKSITSVSKKIIMPNKIADDSFDIALQALGDEDMDFSFNNPQNNKKIKTSPDSLDKEEITTDTTSPISVTQCTLEEIENKRKQALEKLQKKKSSSCETSPLKCSQEEIEKKRLQAIAKLEAKKKQDLIEKNRQEALKRLEINKKRRALQFSISVQPIKLNFPKK